MNKERNIIDDPTGVDILPKEEACPFILHNIEQVYDNADQWDTVSQEIPGITPKEINTYLMALRYNQNLPIKNIKVDSYTVSDPLQLAELYDYTQTYPTEIPFCCPQKIYFIEGDVSAITIIPVLTGEKETTVHMELLFKSAPFIQDIWERSTTSKGLNSIKFANPKDLKKRK